MLLQQKVQYISITDIFFFTQGKELCMYSEACSPRYRYLGKQNWRARKGTGRMLVLSHWIVQRKAVRASRSLDSVPGFQFCLWATVGWR